MCCLSRGDQKEEFLLEFERWPYDSNGQTRDHECERDRVGVWTATHSVEARVQSSSSETRVSCPAQCWDSKTDSGELCGGDLTMHNSLCRATSSLFSVVTGLCAVCRSRRQSQLLWQRLKWLDNLPREQMATVCTVDQLIVQMI